MQDSFFQNSYLKSKRKKLCHTDVFFKKRKKPIFEKKLPTKKFLVRVIPSQQCQHLFNRLEITDKKLKSCYVLSQKNFSLLY